MNLWRILGISGAAFCTSAIALIGAGLATDALKIGLLTAFLQGMLALFQEIQKESAQAELKGGSAVTLGGVMLL
jgi:hypothetical protein